MEVGEKIRKLRSEHGLTQEQLAEKINVSRTAVSKWESGRGWPGIDSLKNLSSLFGVTIDELVSTDEIVTIAESDERNRTSLTIAILDVLQILFFVLPLYGFESDGYYRSVGLAVLPETELWLKALYIILVLLSFADGIALLILPSESRIVITGLVLTIAQTALYSLSRQPYAAFFTLALLVIKGILLLKPHMTLKVS